MAPNLRPFDASFSDDASSVSAARVAVVRFAVRAGVSGAQLDDVRICVSEAVTNAVVHAYPNGQVGRIRVGAAVEDTDLVVRVSDDGCGLNPDTPNPGLGLGLRLMRHFSDGLAIHDNSGVDVQLRFSL